MPVDAPESTGSGKHTKMTEITVLYDYDTLGYTVRVMDNAKIVKEYHAGNHPRDSKIVLEGYGKVKRVSVKQLCTWAKETAQDMAKEQKIKKVRRGHFRKDLGEWRYEII